MAGTTNWRAEMVRLLSSANPKDWYTALALKLDQIPPSLFRYRKADCRSIDAFAQQKLWFAQVRQFNDPYDTSVKVDMAAGVGAVVKQKVRTMSTGLNFSNEIMECIESAADEVIEHFGGEESVKHSDFMQAGTYVACFCEDPTLNPMWAHYGDSRRGFCIEYGFEMMEPENPRYKLLFPVVYSAEKLPLVVNGPPDPTKFNPWIATLASIHKHPDWASEREWRIVVPLGKASAPAWDMGTPNGLILGDKIQPDAREKLMAIARDQHIPVTQIHKTADFGLERRSVP